MALPARRSFLPWDRRQAPTQHGVVICVVPGDHTVPIEIERAPDSGGSPGAYTQVHVGTFAKSGGFFTDYLPNDNATRWYRVRHGKGEIYGNASAYLTAFSAVPRQLREDPLASQSVATAPFSRVDDIGTAAVTIVKTATGNRCRVYNAADQNITSGAAAAALNFDSETFDVGGLHSTSSSTSRVTIPSGGDTRAWIITASVLWAANGLGTRHIYVYKNGSPTTAASIIAPSGGAHATRDTVVFVDSDPTAGDYYEVFVFQDSGSTIAANGTAAGSTLSAVHLW